MDHRQTAVQLLEALARGDSKAAGALMTDDFQFSGAVLEPIGKAEDLKVHEAFAEALPDFSFHPLDAMEKDRETVRMTVGITGTHRGRLSLPWKHVRPAAPTGKGVEMPREAIEVRFRGDLVTAIEVEPVPGGGMMGLLNRMGARVNNN